MTRYLTKSRFKLGLECPTKLFYTGKKEQYNDETIDDNFLSALAEGGFQVGELAKFIFSDDPLKENITISDVDYAAALKETQERLKRPAPVVIAEAAFLSGNLFVRTDLLIKKNDCIELYEVKAKSWDSKTVFLKKDKKGKTFLDKDWQPYLYDVAFQKFVLQNIFRDFPVKAFLIAADKEKSVTIDGLNQLFRITRSNDRPEIKTKKDITRSALGTIPLAVINVDNECDWIYNNPVDPDIKGINTFAEVVELFSSSYLNDKRLWSSIGSKCKACQYKQEHNTGPLKSGFHECWKQAAGFTDDDFDKPLVLDLWSGKAGAKSLINDAIKKKKYFISDLAKDDYLPKTKTKNEDGLSPAERRGLQINKVSGKDLSFFLDEKGLRKIFDKHKPPYHFIDFETSMVALPFHKGRRPYEAIAFQYSYHVMDEDGKIEHKNEYLNIGNSFPNYSFLRSLKDDLQGKEGTIFRYHSHENNYLRFIYNQLLAEPPGTVSDRQELIGFIKEITHSEKKAKDTWSGKNDMVDLWELVLSYYYSPTAKGSNSIKDILPAVIHDSKFIRDKYSQPVYGTDFIKSKNFKEHAWINSEKGNNPYKTLPPVIAGYDNDTLDHPGQLMDEIMDGGAAMMAYSYLQFSDISPEQKESIRKALLRYCELDTMAMVMIWEFWGNEIGMFK